MARPAETQDRGQWWKAFRDPQLDRLVEQAGDTERALVRDTVAAYADTLRHATPPPVRRLRRARRGTRAIRAAGNEAEALSLDRQRAQLENAPAVLVGESASSFSLAPADWSTALPVVVLARRPGSPAWR